MARRKIYLADTTYISAISDKNLKGQETQCILLERVSELFQQLHLHGIHPRHCRLCGSGPGLPEPPELGSLIPPGLAETGLNVVNVVSKDRVFLRL